MKSLRMNLQLSKSIYEVVQDSIELKGCYNNTFNTMSELGFSKEFDFENYRVGYGFLKKNIGDTHMFFRHGFIIDNKNDQVIDVTACLWNNVEEDCSDFEYYVFKEYKMDDYVDALMRCNGMPALFEDTQEEEVALYNELVKNNMECNPIDQMDLLTRIYKENIIEGIKEFNEGKSVLYRCV